MGSVGNKEDGNKTPGNENTESNVEDKGSSMLPRKRGSKSKGQVTSSWALRPKSRENPKAPEANESAKEESIVVEKKRRQKNKKAKGTPHNEFSRTKKRLGYLLHRIMFEQNLIDAYTAEGWKGQSVEKIKPEKELLRAKSHILSYKLKIRALFQQLDQSLHLGKIPEVLFDDKGEIDSEDIFCAKCGSKDVTLDNDIILCDGSCDRGFHQYCLEPPLSKEQIPLGDEGWLCPGCDCKADCIDLLSDFQGSKLSVLDSWEKIFPEAALGTNPDNGVLGSSSDDSEDGEYDSEKPKAEVLEGDASNSDNSSYFSASDNLCAAADNANNIGLPSDDSEDDDFDPSEKDSHDQREDDSSSSDFSSDSEDLDTLLNDASMDEVEIQGSISHTSEEKLDKGCKKDMKLNGKSLKDELSYLLESGGEPLAAKRHVNCLDYKKLNDETYGDLSSDTSDEDFEDGTSRKRRRIKRDKNEKKSSPMADVNSEDKNLPKESANSQENATKGSQKRFSEAAKKRLYEAFTENQHPEKSVRENLAKELGMTVEQVRKWFENARWSFNHRKKMESHETNSKPRNPRSSQNAGNETLTTVPIQFSSDLGSNSEATQKSKKRKS